MANIQFAPADVTVTAGSTVTWTNTDEARHNVTFPHVADCGDAFTNATVSAVFTVPGTYSYICVFHNNMKGTVTVE